VVLLKHQPSDLQFGGGVERGLRVGFGAGGEKQGEQRQYDAKIPARQAKAKGTNI
jgi:hypothetical protein